MRLSQKLLGGLAGSRKGWSQPPFWSLDTPLWTSSAPDKERLEHDFQGYIAGAYKDSGPVFACSLARQMMFSEVRYAWQRERDGRPGPRFTDPALGLLKRPWPSGTTGELAARMIQDADLAGNAYITTTDDEGRHGRRAAGPSKRLVRMRPDWVTIVLGSHSGNLHALDTRVVAFLYEPPAPSGQDKPEAVLLLPSEVAHFSPIPDPAARFRGMSWLTPVVREIMADKSATKHKLKFFEQGASIQTVVSLDKDVTPTDYEEFVAKFRAQTEGVDMAYKTLFLGGGADVTLRGADLKQIEFKATQGAGETRIASAAGMHPVLVGLSEGLQGSALNAGNFEAAVRLTADKTIRPLWRMSAACLETLLQRPDLETDLTYDPRDVAFLQDSTTDAAAIQANQATTARQLTDAGYTPESVIDYLETGDLRQLKHSGYYSVQLQQLGSINPTPPEE